VRDFNIDFIYVLGDITDAKDHHSSILVNRIVDGFKMWAGLVKGIKVLLGNHDGLDASSPYFRFLQHIPGIEHISNITEVGHYLFLPHTRTPEDDWKDINLQDKVVFAHVSVDGSVYETGTKQEGGISDEVFSPAAVAFSGDIHSRQTVGSLNYVGCPYRVRFNDPFQGGGIILMDYTCEDSFRTDVDWEYVNFDFLNRHTFDFLDLSSLEVQMNKAGVKAGDQVKLRLHINDHNMADWRSVKAGAYTLCEDLGIELCGYSEVKDYQEVVGIADTIERRFTDFETFGQRQNISPELMAFGKQIIQEAS
jgi:hypothetical protein